MSRGRTSVLYERFEKTSFILAKQKLRENVIAFYKFMGRVNTREELFKLKGNVGTRTNGYELAMNKMEIRGRFVTKRTLKFSNNLSIWLGKILTYFEIAFNKFMKRDMQYGEGTSVN